VRGTSASWIARYIAFRILSESTVEIGSLSFAMAHSWWCVCCPPDRYLERTSEWGWNVTVCCSSELLDSAPQQLWLVKFSLWFWP